MFLYSVVIPTRQRYQYLASAVDSILQFGKDVEIIVSVNGDHMDFKIVKAFLGHRVDLQQLRIVYTERVVPMYENFEFGLSHATGNYVTTLGDDDALMFCYRNHVDSHFRNHPNSILTWYRGAYFWNDTPQHGQLSGLPWQAPIETSFASKLHYSQTECVSYNDLPNIYNSFFPLHLIDFIKGKNKSFFGEYKFFPHPDCIAPDIFSAIQSLYLLSGSYFLTNSPISISGIGAKSNGLVTMSPGELSDENKKFKDENQISSFRTYSKKYLFDSDSHQLWNAAIQAFAHKIFSPHVQSKSWNISLPWIINLTEAYICCEASVAPYYAIDFIKFLRLYVRHHGLIDKLKHIYTQSFSMTSSDEMALPRYSFRTILNIRSSKPASIHVDRFGCLNSFQAVLYYSALFDGFDA